MDKLFKLGLKHAHAPQHTPADNDGPVIRNLSLGPSCEVNTVEDRTREQVAAQIAAAKRQIEERAQAGLNDGLNAGKAEYSLQMMDLVMAQLDALEDLERSVVDVVCSALDDVIAQIPPQERITRVVKKGLVAVRGERKILVKVSLPDETAVRAALNTYLISDDGRTGFVEVFADANLKPGDCIIETSMGVIQASFSSQLNKLKQALNQVVGRASQ